MADDHKDRPTSHAKSVDGLVRQESSLDRGLALKEQFQKAQNQHQQTHQSEQAKDGAQRGTQGKAPSPGQHLRMRGPLGTAVTKKEDKTDLRKLDVAVKQKSEDARKAKETFDKLRKSAPDHDRDNEK